MGKKLNKEEKACKKLKAQEFQRRMEVAKLAQKDQAIRSRFKIPGEVAIPYASEELLHTIGETCYTLSFHYYNFKACELYKISNQGETASLIRLLDLMTKTSPTDKSLIIRDRVEKKCTNDRRSLEYKKYFFGLPPDIDYIYEKEIAGDGRVFFFTTESVKKNYISIITIAKHPRIDRSC